MNKIFKVIWNKSIAQWVVTSELAVPVTGRTLRTSAASMPSARLAKLALSGLLVLYGPQAFAQANIQNIGFETGTLTGWTYSQHGNQASGSYGGAGVGASVVSGMTDFTPNIGAQAGNLHKWTVTPFGNYMASLQAGGGGDSFDAGATTLGLTSTSRTAIATTMAGTPTNSSWLYQDLTLAAGASFSMAWQYVSTDYDPFNDASITSLVNLGDNSIFATVNNQSAQYALLGATNLGTGSYSTGSYGATGWQVATYQVSVAGTYRLGFLSMNLDDTSLSPILFVDEAPGLTYDFGVPFQPVAPNPGSGAPVTPPVGTGPVVIDTSKGTDDLGNSTEASFEGGTLVVKQDLTVTQNFSVDEKNGTIDQAGHDSTFTGHINDATNGTPGSLTIGNSGNGGSVTLAAVNGYTGSTTVDQGAKLSLSGQGSIADSSKVVINGQLDVAQAGPNVNLKALDGEGQVELGTNTLSLNGGDGDFAGKISGQGAVSINGGTQVLSGDNTYTGGTTLNGGELQISSDGNLGDAAGGLTFNGGTLHSTGEVTSMRDITLAGTGTFDTATGTTLRNSGAVTGSGGLVKNGQGGLALSGSVGHSGGTTVNEGVLVLSGDNTYTGGTTLNGGELQISSDGNLGDAAGGLTFNGGTLHSTGEVTSMRDITLAGTGTFDTATGTTLRNSGAVSGSGGLVKNGEGGLALSGSVGHSGGTTVNEGVLVLSGDNTYTGGTTLNGGELQISSDGNLGDAAGGLTFNGGTLHSMADVTSMRDMMLAGTGRFDTATGTTLSSSGAVSGNGGLVKNGEGGLALSGNVGHSGGTTVNEGLLVLSGDNTYTGGTTLNGGTLQISSDGNLGDAAGVLTFNGGKLQSSADLVSRRQITLDGLGTLGTASGTTTTLEGTLSGQGMLVKDGQGVLVLGAANSYGGGTAINAGTVVLANAQGLGEGSVALNNATLRTAVDADLSQAFSVTDGGTISVGEGTTTRLSGIVDGSQNAGCFVKSGSGRLNMTGSAVMANGTCVTEGILSTNGLLTSRVQVDRAGTLRGVGNVAGNVNVEGTLAPGNSPGTLTVSGSINMNDSSTLQIDIDGYGTAAGAGNYSRVILTGVGSTFHADGALQPLLRGITGSASNAFTPKAGDMFRIVSGQGGVSGTFDRLVQPTSGLAEGTRFQVYYTTGYDIDLYVTPSSYGEQLAGQVSGNTLETAVALDRIVEANDLDATTPTQQDLLRGVWEQPQQALAGVIGALSGETHANLAALAQASATAMADDVTGRLSRAAVLSSADVPVEQLLWVNMGYGDFSVDADADAGRFDASQRRVTAGIDVYRSDRFAAGAGLGHSESELEHSPLDNSIDSDAFFVYGAVKAGPVTLDGLLSYATDQWVGARTDALTPTGQLTSQASGHTRLASLGASLPFTAAGLTWQPSLRGTYQKIQRNAFVEDGSALTALAAPSYEAEGGRALAGISVGSLTTDPLKSRWTWQVGVQGGVNYGQARQAEVWTTLAGEAVRARSASPGRTFTRGQGEATLRTSTSSYLYGGVSTEQGSGMQTTNINLGLRVAL